MRFWSLVVGLVILLSDPVSAWEFAGEYESRNSGSKVNLFFSKPNLEIYILKTSGILEVEAGPRVRLGPLTLTGRAGGIYRVTDNTPYFQIAGNTFLKYGRLRILTINELSLEDFSPETSYLEGFTLIDLQGLLNRCEFGSFYEYYEKDDSKIWVVGPMFTFSWPEGVLQQIALWAGITNNPTVAVNFEFGLDW